jgi:hypothetical protein
MIVPSGATVPIRRRRPAGVTFAMTSAFVSFRDPACISLSLKPFLRSFDLLADVFDLISKQGRRAFEFRCDGLHLVPVRQQTRLRPKFGESAGFEWVLGASVDEVSGVVDVRILYEPVHPLRAVERLLLTESAGDTHDGTSLSRAGWLRVHGGAWWTDPPASIRPARLEEGDRDGRARLPVPGPPPHGGHPCPPGGREPRACRLPSRPHDDPDDRDDLRPADRVHGCRHRGASVIHHSSITTAEINLNRWKRIRAKSAGQGK